MAGLLDDLGGYSPEQAWRGRYRARRGGILDMLPDDEAMPRDAEPAGLLSSVRSVANQALGLLDHYTMGIPSTAAGLINAAIPFQPLGDMMTSVQAGRDAADAFAANGRGARDLLSLPDAFGGHVGSAPHVPAGARLTAEGAAQAGRGIDNALSSAVRAMPEGVGSFGGRLAKTADHNALAKAEQLDAVGTPREQIWQDTGWFKGVDGKWRFEIDDSTSLMRQDRDLKALYNSSAPDNQNLALEKSIIDRKPKTLGDAIDHDSVFGAYPDLASMTFKSGDSYRNGYHETAKLGGLRSERISTHPGDRSSTLHEIQHAIQKREGLADGGNPDKFAYEKEFGPGVMGILKGIKQAAQERSLLEGPSVSGPSWDYGLKTYRNLAGEVEARAVEKRANLTPDQRRARAPWLDYDVPEDQQIVRFGGSGPQMSAPYPAGIRAYHGSPYDFDKFDMSKIGTGEGAQAYGPGMYFAEAENVAKQYRDELATKSLIDRNANARDPKRIAGELYNNWMGDVRGAMHDAKFYDNSGEVIAALGQIEKNPPKGRMYEVRINADPEHFLDWDKPLSQQPEKARPILQQHGVNPDAEHLGNALNGAHDWSGAINGWDRDSARKLLAQDLRDAGIPGTKYLDQRSRDVPLEFASKAEAEAAGYRNGGHDIAPGRYAPYDAGGMYVSDPKGTRNYVVFDADKIEILRKYGIAGTMVAGGGMAVSSSDVEAHPALIPLLIGVGAFAGGLSNDADRAELMLIRQSPRLYDYAPKPGMLDLMGRN